MPFSLFQKDRSLIAPDLVRTAGVDSFHTVSLHEINCIPGCVNTRIAKMQHQFSQSVFGSIARSFLLDIAENVRAEILPSKTNSFWETLNNRKTQWRPKHCDYSFRAWYCLLGSSWNWNSVLEPDIFMIDREIKSGLVAGSKVSPTSIFRRLNDIFQFNCHPDSCGFLRD
jgi:hypothetical protein